MGANIRIEGRQAIVAGEDESDGRAGDGVRSAASASLVLAALVAEGETTIDRVYHMDRGYERIEAKAGRGRSEHPTHNDANSRASSADAWKHA